MNRPWTRPAVLGLAALVMHLVLVQPNHPAAMTWSALLLFPLELPVILLALVALQPGTAAAYVVRGALVATLMCLVVLKIADLAMFIAFNRGFNLVFDWPLAESGWTLLAGAIGLVPALVAALAALAALSGLAALLWWAAGVWLTVTPRRPARIAAAVGAGLGVLVATAEVGQALGIWRLPANPPGAAFTARVAWERVATYRVSRAGLASFRAAAATDPLEGRTDLFDVLSGRDVLIVFVESYGRTSFETPLYARTHLPTLSAADEALAGAGLEAHSGWLASPVSGGQSWLAHGTLASGMTTGDQTTYGAMLSSLRRTLFHLAADAGYLTAAVMPAITRAWPEGRRLGFGKILAAADLGYRGAPFNWVTMPDQYTLSVFRDRLGAPAAPLFAQIALISSHAPWVPVPELIAWSEVGDGTSFDRWAASGDSPETVWRDKDRVRDQYRLSIDYALRTVMEFAARQGPDGPLMVILGDHQPASFVSLSDSSDVPVHIIGPKAAVAPFETWGWTPGLIPDHAVPTMPMQDFRDAFVRAVSSGLGPEGAS